MEEGVKEESSKIFKRIVQKAKKSRNKLEKSLNNSQDHSFDGLGRLQKKKSKKFLSQSFVMQQTTALSLKNKHLVTALVQTRKLAKDLEDSLRLMQSTLMSVGMTLNSREVELDGYKRKWFEAEENLKEKDELLENLRNKLHQVVDEMIPVEKDKKRCSEPSVDFSFRPRRIATALTSKSKNSKWQPDLTILQERMGDDALLETSVRVSEPSLSPCSSNEDEDDIRDSVSPRMSLKSWLNSSQDQDDSERFRKKRRRAVLFSNSPLDFNNAVYFDTYNSSLSLDDIVKEKSEDHETHETNVVEEEEQCKQTHDNTHETNNVSREAHFDHKETEKPEIADLWNEAETENVTDPALVSMELTQPLDTSIKKISPHESPEDKPPPQKKRQKRKPTITKKKKKGGHEEAINSVANEIFDCSNDSFLVNPDKRITLAKEDKLKEKQKRKSLPLMTITNNESTERSRRRRRTANVSYAEPNLHSKLRRGDKNTDATLYLTLSPTRSRKRSKQIQP